MPLFFAPLTVPLSFGGRALVSFVGIGLRTSQGANVRSGLLGVRDNARFGAGSLPGAPADAAELAGAFGAFGAFSGGGYGVKIDVQGAPELRAALRAMQRQLDREVRTELKALAETVAADARGRAPVRTGRLQRSIKPFARGSGDRLVVGVAASATDRRAGYRYTRGGWSTATSTGRSWSPPTGPTRRTSTARPSGSSTSSPARGPAGLGQPSRGIRLGAAGCRSRRTRAGSARGGEACSAPPPAPAP